MEIFLLVTFGQKYVPMCDRNGLLMNQWMWVINYDATKVKAVDKNSPLIMFVGQHGFSYLGHKLPKMPKNSEFRACRVDTNLGQCALVDIQRQVVWQQFELIKQLVCLIAYREKLRVGLFIQNLWCLSKFRSSGEITSAKSVLAFSSSLTSFFRQLYPLHVWL